MCPSSPKRLPGQRNDGGQCQSEIASRQGSKRSPHSTDQGGFEGGLPKRTATNVSECLRTLASMIQSPTNVYERLRTVWCVHGMEEVRSSILLSSTHNYAVLALAGTAFCDLGGFVGASPYGEESPVTRPTSAIEQFCGFESSMMFLDDSPKDST